MRFSMCENGGMLKRFFAPPTIPAWIIFGWTMVSNAYTARALLGTAETVTTFLDHHNWVGNCLAAILLLAGASWPSWKRRLPKWVNIPKAPHELVSELKELSILISQADTMIDLLSYIERQLPESDAAKAPF